MKRPLPSVLVMVGLVGIAAAPAFGQLSTLPPLQFCSSRFPAPCPQYFVPRDGIPVPNLEIVPWDSPRAVEFLNTFTAETPSDSLLGQFIQRAGSDAIIQVIQEGVNDPALINSFGRLVLELSEESPEPDQLQQAEADFLSWLQSQVSFIDDDQPTIDDDDSLPEELIPLQEAITEVLNTLPTEEREAILNLPEEELEAVVLSLIPQTPVAHLSLSQRGQESVSRYLLDRTQLRRRMLQNPAPMGAARPSLDLSGLNLSALATAEGLPFSGVPPAAVSGSAPDSARAVREALRLEVEAYPMATMAADLFKAAASPHSADVAPVAQETSLTPAAIHRPWSAFISGDIAWGNAQGVPDFDVNQYVIMAGADYTFNPNFLLGGAIAYSTGSQRNDLATADADSVSLNLYGTGTYGSGGYTTGFIGYGFDSFSSRRTIAIPGSPLTALGSSSGNQFNVGVETGWFFTTGGVILEPSLGLRYVSNRVNGYTETGADPWATVIDGYNSNSTIANLGLNVAYPILTGDRYILPFVGLGLNHRLGYSAPVITARFVGGGDSFVLPIDDIDRTWFDLTAGVSADLSPNTVGQILFRTDLGRFDANLNSLSVNLRHRF
ncbi:autotransporter domain-containing protein [Leptolyngbya sp. BL0902]|uniref:autotransporter outer membrane beta-barrel domain-containing protein n=1 Tax=Leptolyngbya sp. BL0902 TaxID=1115757 RepID=UPI0018E8EC10|nr:autotransporter outer membrane beta-barrel domain-containing protein [Leptolyngbya sp. BL0902]QQE67250.1 autotransporter domain-containing protein [Leptolyngbya sp. BL0902]